MGVPSTYTKEHAAEILARVAAGEPLAKVCREIGPHRSVVYDWAKQHEDFAAALKVARDDGEEAIAAECLEIADDRDDKPDSRKVRVWTRLQLLARWNPKKWSERTTLVGDKDNPVAITTIERRVVKP